MPAITILDLNNAKLDANHIAAIATSTQATATDRLGHVKPTIAGAVNTINGRLGDVETAKTAATAGMTTQVAAVEARKGQATAAMDAGVATVDTRKAQSTAAMDAGVAAVETRKGQSTAAMDAKVAAVQTASALATDVSIPAILAAIPDYAVIGKDTLASLNADIAHGVGVIAFVTNDPIPANNAYYRKVGAAGAGAWVASTAVPPSVLSDRISAAAVRADVSDGAINSLVATVPPPSLSGQMPWVVAGSDGQPILGVKDDGTVHAILDRLPGLDMLDSRFRYANCDENGYVLWGIQWDGQIYVLGQSNVANTHAMIVRGDLWAIGPDGLAVQVTEALEVSAPTLSGGTINYLVRVGGGLVPATAQIPASNAWAAFVTTVLHVLGYGQSLAMGTSSTVNTVRPQCANRQRTLKIGVQLADQDGMLEAADCLPLRGLVANTLEAPIVQHMGQLQRIGGMPLHAGLVASLHGRGGATVAQLSKGSRYYSNAMTAAQAVYSDSAALGLAHRVPYIDMIQGEADRTAAPGAYTTSLLQLQSDFDADVRAITGQTGTIPMLLDQISNWTSYNIATSNVPLEQLDMARQYPQRAVCAGPKYWIQTGTDGTHQPSIGSRQNGAMHARAAAAIMAGIAWYPTHCIAATRVANVVTLKFYTPYGRLVADTVSVSDPGNLGIRWVDDTNSASVSSVRVNLDNTVTVTLSGTPTGTNGYIGIADIGVPGAGGGPFTGPRACLRDSSTDKCGDGLPLYNWACHQRVIPN